MAAPKIPQRNPNLSEYQFGPPKKKGFEYKALTRFTLPLAAANTAAALYGIIQHGLH